MHRLPAGEKRRCARPRLNPERLRSDDYALKIYGRRNDAIVAEAVDTVAAARNLAPAQVALASGMTAPIFGATRAEHVDAAVAALEITLDPAAIMAIDQAYEPRAARRSSS